MRIKNVRLRGFKRFTDLEIADIPESAKMVVMVGPNGSGKTSFFEAFNHFYQMKVFNIIGEYNYLYKAGIDRMESYEKWHDISSKMVNISFFDDVGYDRSKFRGSFYFRSAYRNEPDFKVEQMHKQDDPRNSYRLVSLIHNDMTVSSNYQRLISNTISKVFDESYDNITVDMLRNELIGIIQKSMERVFDDLKFTSVGNPLSNGNFYFTKGEIKDFHYRNLSAGEKAAFDLILDMVIQSQYYSNAVYCIDEPELHMHTKLQGKVLRELYSLIPEKSQMWISTHSIGMLQEAQELEKANPGTVVFLDFGDRDYDENQIIRPTKISRTVLNKFYELALGDYSKLLLPETIVFCEGDTQGKKRRNFDKNIYTMIFEKTHPDVLFLSGGSCSEIENIDNRMGDVMSSILSKSKIFKVIDRDDRSVTEVEELKKSGVKTLSRRHLESYLLDDEVIRKLCEKENKSNLFEQCIEKKKEAINNVIKQGKPADDIKSARGEIYNSIKSILGLSRCGNSADSFIRDTITPLFSPDLEVYKQLEKDIFE